MLPVLTEASIEATFQNVAKTRLHPAAETGLPDFSCFFIPKPEKCTKRKQNGPNSQLHSYPNVRKTF
jgi:hypothetical protein